MDEYFRFTMDFHQEHNVITNFQNDGIMPSDSQGYSLQDVRKSVLTTFGNLEADAKLICAEHDGKQMLYSITMYLDLNYNAVEMPCKKKRNLAEEEIEIEEETEMHKFFLGKANKNNQGGKP